MTKIKICGITTEKEIEFINELLPEYIGFVFSKSTRRVDIEKAAYLSSLLNPRIKIAGVFVNETLEYAKRAAEQAKLHVLQLHGEEEQEYIDALTDYEVWKAVGVNSSEDLENIQKYQVHGFLFDSRVNGSSGGSGLCFDWNILKGFHRNTKLILAGGLNCDNVGQAIRLVNPDIVDVSSGVEQNGLKDKDKCRKFVDEVRKL